MRRRGRLSISTVQPLNNPGLTQKHFPAILSQAALGQHSVVVVDSLISLINSSVH
jgi:hypothetical protein